MTRACKNCVYLNTPDGDTGFCRRFPPQVHSQPSGALSGSFPPVNIETFWCGEFKAVKSKAAQAVW